MNKKVYHAIDIAKFVSALLVVCIHTFPFMDLSETMNFVVVSIVARVAVPFFFIVSAFFFYQKIDFHKDYRHVENTTVLKTYVWRLAKIYLIWTLIYLPYSYLLMRGDGFGLVTFIRYIRDFFFTGSYYHLWFLPALMFSIVASYVLIFKIGFKKAVIISFALYLIGMAGNLYADILLGLPGIATIFAQYVKLFVTTRNGLFFGMIFIVMGAYLAKHPIKAQTNQLSLLTGISIALYIVECLILKMSGRIQDLSSMYLMLVPCVFFLFARLMRIELKPQPLYKTLRILSLLIYVSHILFAQACLWLMPDMHSFMLYSLTVGLSFLLSYVIYRLSLKVPLLKQLY